MGIDSDPKECLHFEACDAPLCPLDEDLGSRVWFPDEPVCVLQRTAYEPDWMYAQRKISLAAGARDTCFVLAMLQPARRVRHGIAGINPDSARRKDRIRSWLKSHPAQGCENGSERLARLQIRLSGGAQKVMPLPGARQKAQASSQEDSGMNKGPSQPGETYSRDRNHKKD